MLFHCYFALTCSQCSASRIRLHNWCICNEVVPRSLHKDVENERQWIEFFLENLIMDVKTPHGAGVAPVRQYPMSKFPRTKFIDGHGAWALISQAHENGSRGGLKCHHSNPRKKEGCFTINP